MAYVKVPAPSVVYHLAKADRLDSILDDGQIRRFEDSECWFCESLPKMKAYMAQTVMCEGKPYYNVTGQLCRYPAETLHLRGAHRLRGARPVADECLRQQGHVQHHPRYARGSL